MSDQKPHRLVTFLGKPPKGSYDKTTYRNPTQSKPESFESDLVAEALWNFLQPTELVVLATDGAWEILGEDIQSRAEQNNLTFSRETLPVGQTQDEIWKQFNVLKDALRLPNDNTPNDNIPIRKVTLDVTHGFRSQPFLAAGALMFLRLVDKNPPDFSIYYGAFEAKKDNQTPIWDLTPLNDLISWSSDIMLFLKTGRTDGLASATETIGRSLNKEWAIAGQWGDSPSLDQLGKALARFGSDLETVRTGSLLLEDSSANALCSAIDNASEIAKTIPPLADVLGRVRELVSHLHVDSRLSEPNGIRTLKTLARTYFQMGRYAEAASTMREAYINRHACEQSDCPGQPTFQKEHRKAAEDTWFYADENRAKEIGQVRNDIEHAGYNDQPMPPATIKEMIERLIEELSDTQGVTNE